MASTSMRSNSSLGSSSGSPRAAQTADHSYMAKHHVSGLVERLLQLVVPSRHPRPYEAISHALLPNPPGKSVKVTSPTRSSSPPALFDSLHYDVFSVDAATAEGIELVHTIFARHGVLAAFDIPDDTLRAWAAAVRCNYRPAASVDEAPAPIDVSETAGLRRAVEGDDAVAYHNFRHALNALHTMHVFLDAFGGKKFFGEADVLSMLVAALCHDVQHPGRDNEFLRSVGHPMTLRYLGDTPLEHHQCAVTFAITADEHTDICSAFRYGDRGSPMLSAKYREWHAATADCILATASERLPSVLDALCTALAADGFDPQAKPEHRRAVRDALVAAASASTEVRAFPFSRQWAPLLEEERCRQGDAERALGLDVPQCRDRDSVSRGAERTKLIDANLPLFEALEKALPGMAECVRNLKSNRDTWQALA